MYTLVYPKLRCTLLNSINDGGINSKAVDERDWKATKN